MTKTIKNTIALVFLLVLLPQTFAALQLNDIQFDPAIIASGDEVDIIVQYEEAGVFDDDKIANTEYTFKVLITPDDDLTKQFVTMLDSEGDQLYGSVYSNQEFSRIFRIKVNQDAPAANYQFKLEGQWYKNDDKIGSPQSVKFNMPVKKEGIVLDVSTIITEPSQLRPGDKFAIIKAHIANTGEKTAKAISLQLQSPDGIKPSYSDNNDKYIAVLQPGQEQEITFSVNINDTITSGAKEFTIKTTYQDSDNNMYQKNLPVTVLIKPRPFLEITKTEGAGRIGSTEQLMVYITNTGEQSAESVDARLIKQYSQPFTIDVRSDFVGEIQPGETAIAVFDVKTESAAVEKNHTFQLVLRAKGDSDEGDDTIYTFNRRAEFPVSGSSPNLILYGSIGVGVILLAALLLKGGKKK